MNTLDRRTVIASTLAAAGAIAVPAIALAATPHDPLVEWGARLVPAARRMRLAQHQRQQKIAEMERRGFSDWPVFHTFSSGVVPGVIILWDGDVSQIERYCAPHLATQTDPFVRSEIESLRDNCTKAARAFYEKWSMARHETGLDKAEDEDLAANVALGSIDEDGFINAKPITLAGVLAKLHYAREAAWDYGNEPVDQPPEVRAIEGAIAFLEQSVTA